MRFSVIIPNLNSPIIDRVLDSLKKQTFSGQYEVLVIGQDKYGLVNEDAIVRHIVTESPVSPAIARNIGIRESAGEILAFIDADCIANPQWLEQLDVVFDNSMMTVVGGGISFPQSNYWTVCDNLATFYEYLTSSKAGERSQLPSLNLSVRKICLSKSGGFDERYPFPAGEDSDFTTRLRQAGFLLLFQPNISVEHLPNRRSFISVFHHAYRFGRFSIKVDPRYQTFLGTPFLFRNSVFLLLLSPILATGVLARMATNRTFLQYLHTIPIIFLIKITWCFGAARTLMCGSPLRTERT